MGKGRKEKHRGRYVSVGIFFASVVLCAVVSVRAAGSGLFIQNYGTEEDRVIVYCSSLENEHCEAGQFTAMISGLDCPVIEVSTTEQKQEGITYYCLVDVSGSMYQEQMEQAKGVLAEICGRLEENDNMVIGALGTTLETTEFLKDKKEIMKVIDGLSGESDYTAIYNAVLDSISELQSNNSCNRKKCLVLLSDGDDETVWGSTREEALGAVRDSKIPVYTVAAIRRSPSAAQKESAENLGAFARWSAGGKDYPPVGKDYTSVSEEFDAEEAGRSIVEDMHSGVILTLDVSGMKTVKDEALLSISFKTDTATYNDTMNLYGSDLKIFSDESGETEQSTVKTSVEESSEGSEDMQHDKHTQKDTHRIPVYAIAMGILFLLLVFILVIFLCRRKNRQEKAAKEAEKRAEATAEKADDEEAREKETQRQGEGKKVRTPDMTVFCPSSPVPYYEVKFTAIGHENVIFILKIPEEKTVTIGRNKKADLVLNPEDKHLSSVQCRIRSMQNAINVWDMNSQNGTFVNGVPIRQIGMATVQNNDVVRMGSYEYRINITKINPV